jgi:hypothetical protein
MAGILSYVFQVGLLNLEDEEFGRKLVEQTHAKLQVCYQSFLIFSVISKIGILSQLCREVVRGVFLT